MRSFIQKKLLLQKKLCCIKTFFTRGRDIFLAIRAFFTIKIIKKRSQEGTGNIFLFVFGKFLGKSSLKPISYMMIHIFHLGNLML